MTRRLGYKGYSTAKKGKSKFGPNDVERVCSKCKKTKPLSEFYPSKATPLGVTCACKECHRLKYVPREKKVRFDQRCKCCGQRKPFDKFRTTPKGLSQKCRECLTIVIPRKKGVKHKKKQYPSTVNVKWNNTFKKGRDVKYFIMQTPLDRLCAKCKILKPIDQFPRSLAKSSGFSYQCKQCRQKYLTGLYNQRRSAGLCITCGVRPFVGKDSTRCCECKESRSWSVRLKALEVYEAKCRCCGEDEPRFLTFHHINEDRSAERKEGIAQVKFWTSLIDKKRDDIEVLCWNCHFSSHWTISGLCPHEEKRRNALRLVGVK